MIGNDWDSTPANDQEIELLNAMLRDRDWTKDTDLRNRKWVIDEYRKGFDSLSHAEVTDLANYFRRFKRHKMTPVERRDHLHHVFGAEGLHYS